MNLFLLVHVSCLLILTDCYKSSEGDDHGALFIFGDSMFDAGNNNYINTTPQNQANYWPYGESYFHPPSGRFSDGRIIPDFIAEFAKLPLIPAYLDPRNNDFSYGANFASAGAGVLNTTDPTTTICLKRQLDNFFDVVKNYRTKLGDAKAEQLLSDAVYLFSFGSNDYQRVPKNETSFYIEQWVQLVVGDLMDVFKAIHEKGGRKIGITSLTTLGCLPAFRFQESGHVCNEQLNMIASLHDSEVSKKLEELSQQLEGFMYAKYELQDEITKRMKNPTKYGFKVGVTACCGYGAFRGIDSCGGKRLFKKFELCDNPSNFILFDCHHPTEATNRQLAKLFWSGDSQVTSPYNLKALFQAAKYKKGGIATIESTNTKSGGEATHVNM